CKKIQGEGRWLMKRSMSLLVVPVCLLCLFACDNQNEEPEESQGIPLSEALKDNEVWLSVKKNKDISFYTKIDRVFIFRDQKMTILPPSSNADLFTVQDIFGKSDAQIIDMARTKAIDIAKEDEIDNRFWNDYHTYTLDLQLDEEGEEEEAERILLQNGDSEKTPVVSIKPLQVNEN